jgi:enoyl-CoA hydratase
MSADRSRCSVRRLGLPLEQALALEAAHGMPVMLEEGIHGAQRFLAGAGRHGSFDC